MRHIRPMTAAKAEQPLVEFLQSLRTALSDFFIAFKNTFTG